MPTGKEKKTEQPDNGPISTTTETAPQEKKGGWPSDKTDTKKEAVLKAMEESLGVVTEACKIAGVGRSTFYEWLNDDEEFKRAVDDIQEIALDFAESALFKQIKGGEISSTIFYLKTKGKQRGYIEKSEVDFKGKIAVEQIVGMEIND